MSISRAGSGFQNGGGWSEKWGGFCCLQKLPDYLETDLPDEMRAALIRDERTPKGLRAVLSDDDFCAVFRPEASEIRALVQRFGMYSHGSYDTFVGAFRLIRLFLAAVN